jgi:flagellar L-ring protein FlgH
MRLTLTFLLFGMVGCAEMNSAKLPSLVNTDTTIRPQLSVVSPMSKGSLVPQFTHNTTGVRGLFEERRISRVGDTLMVLLNETTRASKDGGTSANRQSNGNSSTGLNFSNVTQSKNSSNALNLGLNSSGGTSFDAKGAASASNQFSGSITATVIEVLLNGNLVIAGEKRIAVGAEEEYIRFGGVVSPMNIKENTVLSSQVADVRLEYRGVGITDEAQRAGWLTQLMMRYSPN